MENITMSEMDESTMSAPTQEVRLVDIPISDENMALNVIVSFLGIAQKRGTFSIAESAKIYECIQKFIKSDATA